MAEFVARPSQVSRYPTSPCAWEMSPLPIDGDFSGIMNDIHSTSIMLDSGSREMMIQRVMVAVAEKFEHQRRGPGLHRMEKTGKNNEEELLAATEFNKCQYVYTVCMYIYGF